MCARESCQSYVCYDMEDSCIKLLITNHDHGLIVYTFKGGNPAYACHRSSLFYTMDDCHRVHNFGPFQDTLEPSIGRSGSQPVRLNAPSHCTADRALDTPAVDGDASALCNLPVSFDHDACVLANDGQRSSGNSSILFSHKQFSCLAKEIQTITIRNLQNNGIMAFKPLCVMNDLHARTDRPSLWTSSVVSYNIQQPRTISDVSQPVKHVTWSGATAFLILLTQHTIAIPATTLVHACLIHNAVQIKCAVWHGNGTLEYSLDHITYVLPIVEVAISN